MNINEFFDSLLRETDEDKALDHIFRNIDRLLREGKFEEVNEILGVVPTGKIFDSSLIGFITISRAARDKLENYDKLVKISREYFLDTRGLKTTNGLLGGLE